MSLLVFYYFICSFVCRCGSFFFYFLLSIYVTVSRPYRLLEFYPKKASSMSLCNVLCTGIPLKLAIKKSVPRFLYFLFPEKTWGSGNGVIDAGS